MAFVAGRAQAQAFVVTITPHAFWDQILSRQVSHLQGGVVEKKKEWKQADRPWLLAVEDPQQLGRDIGSGSFNIRNVQQLFAAAGATLRECLNQPTEESEEYQWAAVQVHHSSCCMVILPPMSDLLSSQTNFP